MPSDPRLLVPLSDLPGRMPEGAPVRVRKEAARHAGLCVALGPYERTLGYLTIIGRLRASELLLDLSPPPIVDGWPEHIDGLDVAAAMLARAMGLDPSGGVLWQLAGDSRRTELLSGPPLVLWVLMTSDGECEWSGEEDPALLDIDPADPLAPRLAMAAMLRAHPWRTA